MRVLLVVNGPPIESVFVAGTVIGVATVDVPFAVRFVVMVIVEPALKFRSPLAVSVVALLTTSEPAALNGQRTGGRPVTVPLSVSELLVVKAPAMLNVLVFGTVIGVATVEVPFAFNVPASAETVEPLFRLSVVVVVVALTVNVPPTAR